VYLVEFTFKCGFDSFCAHHLQASLFTTPHENAGTGDDSCVFAQKSQQQVLRLYVRVNVLKVVKMFLQSMEIVFLCMLQQEVQGTLASITIERRTGRVTGRRGAERAKTVLTVLSEAVSALCRLRPLPPRLSRVEPGRWQNACSVLIDRKRPSKSALSRCSDSIRRTP